VSEDLHGLKVTARYGFRHRHRIFPSILKETGDKIGDFRVNMDNDASVSF
jgi:hypothetical protein